MNVNLDLVVYDCMCGYFGQPCCVKNVSSTSKYKAINHSILRKKPGRTHTSIEVVN